jgi:Uncharacterized conserved protein (DUF2267)
MRVSEAIGKPCGGRRRAIRGDDALEHARCGFARDQPADVARWLKPGDDAQPFDAVEVVRRVAEREVTDPATAEEQARAVFVALARLVRGSEIAELTAELPNDNAMLRAPCTAAATRRRRRRSSPM